MNNIYYIEEIPNIFENTNITTNITTINNNNYTINYNKKGFDNRNITEEDNLNMIIYYNKLKLMLDYLLSNKPEHLKISFIEKNEIIKSKNFLIQIFEEFNNNDL